MVGRGARPQPAHRVFGAVLAGQQLLRRHGRLCHRVVGAGLQLALPRDDPRRPAVLSPRRHHHRHPRTTHLGALSGADHLRSGGDLPVGGQALGARTLDQRCHRQERRLQPRPPRLVADGGDQRLPLRSPGDRFMDRGRGPQQPPGHQGLRLLLAAGHRCGRVPRHVQPAAQPGRSGDRGDPRQSHRGRGLGREPRPLQDRGVRVQRHALRRGRHHVRHGQPGGNSRGVRPAPLDLPARRHHRGRRRDPQWCRGGWSGDRVRSPLGLADRGTAPARAGSSRAPTATSSSERL